MRLRTHKKISRQVLTTQGNIAYKRYLCRPADQESADRLMELENKRTVVPMDIVLGIDRLPFKISEMMMLELTYWALKMNSYQAAEDFFLRNHRIRIGDDTIRGVVNFIGGIVYKQDCAEADSARYALETGAVPCNRKLNGVLYLQAEEVAFNTRIRDDDGATWLQNRSGLAFSTDNIGCMENSGGEPSHKILKREYISCIGSSDEFKYHFLALALRAGYGCYRKTVLISDGADWIRDMQEELFPDAQLILDLFSLKETVRQYAGHIFRKTNKSGPWAEEMCNKLADGQWAQVLRELEPYRDVTVLVGEKWVNLYTFIYSNRDSMDYPAYRKEGYFVEVGAVGSGNKAVIQSRLKLQGMRWNVSTAQEVLALKAKLESGLWDSHVVPLVCRCLEGGQ